MNNTACYYIFTYAIIGAIIFQMPCLANRYTNLATDQYALLALKAHITSDPYHVLTRNWTNSSYVCSWIGVTCGMHHHRVTVLNFSYMGLSGTIPPQLGNLSFLVSLDLSYNHFGGTLPKELSLLHRLKFLSTKVNSFEGEIPSCFGHLPKLKVLSLRNNSFVGPIPNSLSNLSNLQILDFSFNSLQGEIPQELGRLHNLKILALQANHLSSVIPLAIFNISTLKIIALTNNELKGSLPTDICSNVPFLDGIYLSNNQMSGQIPSSLSQCSRLKVMYLSFNSFNGRIPAGIGKLKSLLTLDLAANNLSGNIPQEVYSLQNLGVLSLGRNQVTGTLPLSVGNLTMLRILSLPEANLTGVLPREIGQLYQLEVLELGFNTFTGSIPPEIFNISTLRYFGLNGNSLSGALPKNLCYRLPFLEGLTLGSNYLSGPIPNSISNCSNLRTLNLINNEFNGFIPHSLGNLRFIEKLTLGSHNLKNEPSSSELNFITSLINCRSLIVLVILNTPLDGVIPASIGNFSSSFEQLDMSFCKVKGIIPAQIGNLSNLLALALVDNDLSGNIPLTFSHLHKLQGLALWNNNMKGSIPEALCDLDNLDTLLLSQNQFSGSIPKCLGNVSSLRHLHLDSNMLTSSIPPTLWSLKDILSLDLSSNSLSGILPPQMSNLVSSIYINLSMNQLSETIPDTIGSLQNLVDLSLAQNNLEGSIPVSIGSMISLVPLDFSYNNLSGPIPKSLEALQQLVYFNVSFNTLSGQVPTGGPFRNFTINSFKGNEKLCGIPRFQIPLCPAASSHMSTRNNVELALFVLAGVFTMVASLAFIFIIYKRKDKAESRIHARMSVVPERISYYEILRATNQFNESNLLGTGTFGSVYKGILRDGTVSAVKVFNLQLEAAFKSFDVECDILRNIRHRNLTKVISSCSNEDFKALVLQYMPNGNLENWLYSHNYYLDIIQRLNIMIDVALALEYLHYGFSPPIVHCDLKPSNILLDEEMVAHVTDFGIAKLLGGEESIVLTDTQATLGYIAPEYGLEGIVSIRCDVYSYGVMLMETFTRKRPSDDMFAGDLNLKSWVESSLSESPGQIIDADLLMNIEKEDILRNLQCVSAMLELALKCCVESSRDRINMKEALAELQKIKCRFSI